MIDQLGGYRLHRTINVGSIGEVFLAERLARRQADVAAGPARELVVVKRLHRELARLPEHVELFREEGRLARRFSHVNLVKAFDAGEAGGDHFVAMELVRGPNLLQLRAAMRPTIAHAIAIVCDVATGLDVVHQDGLVHCDVGPSNILAGPARAQLTDFGIVGRAGHPQRTVRGTFGYMSPEQVRGEPLDRRSDIFSLGVVLWELLAHAPLFQRRERYLTLAAVVEDEAPPLAGATLAPLDPIVQRALAKDPADRFDSALALADVLRAAAARFGQGQAPQA